MRLPQLSRGELPPEHARVYDSIARTHAGTVSGPFAVWMHSPDLAETADAFRNSFRASDLSPRLYQLLVLVVAAYWNAPYPWSVHARTVLAQDLLPPSMLAEIADGADPAFRDPDEARIHKLVTELLITGSLSDETYAECEAEYGHRLMVEIVTIVGFYSTACLVANAFAIPPAAEVPVGLSKERSR